MIELLAVLVFLFVVAAFVFGLLNFLGADLYPNPKFTCSECERVEEKNGIYKCKACKNEVSGELLYCDGSRRTRDCYKNARKANNER